MEVILTERNSKNFCRVGVGKAPPYRILYNKERSVVGEEKGRGERRGSKEYMIFLVG